MLRDELEVELKRCDETIIRAVNELQEKTGLAVESYVYMDRAEGKIEFNRARLTFRRYNDELLEVSHDGISRSY